jgi:hypothetical protein
MIHNLHDSHCRSVGDVQTSPQVRRRRERLPNTQAPEERALWCDIRRELAEKRRAEREQAKRGKYLPKTAYFEPPPAGGLKRGPKIDPDWDPADKCTAILSGAFTPRELAAFEAARKASGLVPPTRSQFLRFLALQALLSWHLDGHEKRTCGRAARGAKRRV